MIFRHHHQPTSTTHTLLGAHQPAQQRTDPAEATAAEEVGVAPKRIPV